MDALDIITNLDNVIPFFQPIFSADEHRVIGYEVLGRYNHHGKYESLGNFFNDTNIPEEYRIEVDRTVLTKALEKGAQLDQDIYFFINKDVDLLLHKDGEPLLELLLAFEHKGVSPERIVIEVNTQHHQSEIEHLVYLLNYYKTYGINIALDNFGNEGGKLDLIGQISPHIIKVNLKALRSVYIVPGFQEIIYSLSMLARKIGASLLFENIETAYQLQYAWKNGGRYYQGFYLSKPSPEFIDRDLLKDKLREECHSFILSEKKKLETLYSISEKFQTKVAELLQKYRKIEDYEELLMALTKHLDKYAFRMYICDEDGFQMSPNIIKRDKEWHIEKEYIQKNWSWRPYFLENIIKMRKEKRGILSDLYNDLESGENIRTFSYPLNTGHYLFIDLSYEFLYEHQALL